jgi:putative transposase
MYELDKSQGAKYSLLYHFITVVKYRKKIFVNDKIINYAKETMEKIADDFDVRIVEQECGEDHMHILFRAKPTLEITKFINTLKGHSSRYIREKFRYELKSKLWGDSFWSPSYFLATTGNVTIDILKEYVENQRKENQ